MRLTDKEIKVLEVIATDDCGVFLEEIISETNFNKQVIGGIISSLEDKLIVDVVNGQAENNKTLYQHRVEPDEIKNFINNYR